MNFRIPISSDSGSNSGRERDSGSGRVVLGHLIVVVILLVLVVVVGYLIVVVIVVVVALQ